MQPEPAPPKPPGWILIPLLIAFGLVQAGNTTLLLTYRDGMSFIVFLPLWAVGIGIWGATTVGSLKDRVRLFACTAIGFTIAISILMSVKYSNDASAREERASLVRAE